MSKVRFELDKAGVRELLNSSEMRTLLQGYAVGKQLAAGPGYGIRETHTDRVGFNIFPETEEARYDNLENNTLEKVIR
jgi:acyl-CoA-binding protein